MLHVFVAYVTLWLTEHEIFYLDMRASRNRLTLLGTSRDWPAPEIGLLYRVSSPAAAGGLPMAAAISISGRNISGSCAPAMA